MPPSRYADVLLRMRPVWGGRWDETGNTVVDYSGGGRDLTVSGGTRSAKVGPTRRVDAVAVAPSGTISYAGVATSVVDNFTTLGWARVTSAASTGSTFAYVGNSGTNGWGIYLDSTGLKIRMLAGNIAFVDFTAAPTFIVNADYFIVGQRIATTWSMWVNMVYQGTGGTVTPAAPSSALYQVAAPGSGMALVVGGVATFDRVLSAADLGQLYNAGLRDRIAA